MYCFLDFTYLCVFSSNSLKFFISILNTLLGNSQISIALDLLYNIYVVFFIVMFNWLCFLHIWPSLHLMKHVTLCYIYQLALTQIELHQSLWFEILGSSQIFYMDVSSLDLCMSFSDGIYWFSFFFFFFSFHESIISYSLAVVMQMLMYCRLWC